MPQQWSRTLTFILTLTVALTVVHRGAWRCCLRSHHLWCRLHALAVWAPCRCMFCVTRVVAVLLLGGAVPQCRIPPSLIPPPSHLPLSSPPPKHPLSHPPPLSSPLSSRLSHPPRLSSPPLTSLSHPRLSSLSHPPSVIPLILSDAPSMPASIPPAACIHSEANHEAKPDAKPSCSLPACP